MLHRSRTHLFLGVILLCAVTRVSAQQTVPTKGKDFWFGFMENLQPNGLDESLRVFISSDLNTSGTVSVPLLGWSQAFSVTANVTTTVTIPQNMGEHYSSEVIENMGVHVLTQDTVSVFAINFQAYTADASMIFPVKSLGIEYMMICEDGYQDAVDNKSEFLIVSAFDGTEVEITTTCATEGGHAAGSTWTVQLDQGESYQVQAATINDDFTGTIVRGTQASGTCRPFAVFNGSQSTVIPDNCSADDHIFDQALPVDLWGTSYFAVPYLGTTEYQIRIVAAQNGTSVSVNGGAPTILNAGQYTTTSGVSQPMCIQSDRPIGVVQYMESITCGGDGDPAYQALNAQEQEIDRITFSTVTGTAITSHGLNVVVSTANVGQVTLDGVPIPAAQFTPFNNCPTHSYAQLSLTSGSHTLDGGSGRFIGYVYGAGSAESYAYSVGSFRPIPPVQVDTVLCTPGVVTLNAPIDFNNVYWTTVADTSTTLFTGSPWSFLPTTSELYQAHGQNPFSGCPQQYNYSVEIPNPLALDLTAGAVNLCAYEPVQLHVDVLPVSSSYLYSWHPASDFVDPTLATATASPANTTWYRVEVQTISGCAYATDSILVPVLPGNILLMDAGTTDDNLCTGDSAQLTMRVLHIIGRDDMDAGIVGPLWGSVQNGTASAVCGSVTSTALYFDGPGQRAAATIPLDVSAGGLVRFALKIADGVAPCEDADPGENVVLEYSTNGGGSWQNMGTYLESNYPGFTNVDVAIPAAAQTANTLFRWRQTANGGAGEDNWCIDNVAIGVNDNTALTYAWTPAAQVSNATAAAPMAYPQATGYFHVTGTDATTGCTYMDSVYFTVGQGFTLTMTPDTGICDVAGIQLHAIPSSGSSHTWLWAPNTNITSIYDDTPTVTPTSTTTYTVTVTSAQGCSTTGDVTITVTGALSLDATTSDNQLCQGETATLNAVVNSTLNMAFLWSPATGLDDATVQSPVASPLANTWYHVTATDTVAGCTLTDSVYVAVTQVGGIHAMNDTTVCSAIGLHLNVQHNVVNPVIHWTPANYLQNANTASPTVLFDSTATYVVSISDGIGCAAFDTVHVEVVFSHLTYISDSSLCQGQQMVIDAGFPWAQHSWSTGATTQTITVGTAGAYTCTLTDTQTACQVQFTTNVTVDPLPVIDLGVDTSLCVGQTWTLDAGASNAGNDILWNTNATMRTISLTTAGDYWVRVIDGNDCTNHDTIAITFDPLPVIVLRDTTICVSETITLDAGNPGSSYLWSPTGETTRTIDVTAADGTYSVVVTTPTICVDSAHAALVFVPFPVVDLGPDSALCDGEAITLDAGNAGSSYSWHTGSAQQTITLTDDATAWVDVYNGYCTTRDSVEIVFNPLPVPMTEAERQLCLSYPPHHTVIDAGNGDCTFLWNTGEITPAIQVDQYGTYVVRITTPLNCTITDSLTLLEYCPPQCFIPNSFSPDGDGTNDFFFAMGDGIAEMQLNIFDRWGALVYSGSGYDAKWDGKVGGTDVPIGVYVYQVKYRFYADAHHSELLPEREEIGHVSLLR